MFDLLGVDMPPFVKFFIAFATVLVLIGATAFLVRRFGANRLGGVNTRGRQPRLAVIDAATVDGRRRLVLIRRDNVEHLLMIGGPTDLVVEPNILRAAQRDGARETGRAEPALRSPAAESAFPLQPVNEPPPMAPTPAPSFSPVSPTTTSVSRPYRVSVTEEPWHAPEPGARPRPADSLTGLAAELSTRLQPPPVAPAPRQETRQEPRPEPRPEPRQESRQEPPVRASAPPPPPTPEPAPPQTDHNLAEMAHQLEAALRRTPMPEGRPPVTDPLAVPLGKPSPDRSRVEPKFDMNRSAEAAPQTPPRQEPKLDMKPDAGAAAGKTVYDSLEEEMASLLGRPPGKT